MSGTGLRVNTGRASAANRNFYALRVRSTGELLPLKRAFGSVTGAWNWADDARLNLDDLETVDLRHDPAAAAYLRGLGILGLPKDLGR